jgi:hypothetical protein
MRETIGGALRGLVTKNPNKSRGGGGSTVDTCSRLHTISREMSGSSYAVNMEHQAEGVIICRK